MTKTAKRMRMKIKNLPSSRERNRYIVFEILSKKMFESSSIYQALWNSALQLFGEVGTSELSMVFLSNLYNKDKRIGIIKCNHDSVEKVRLAIANIKNIEDEPIVMRTIGLTGTINSAKSKFLNIYNLENFSSAKKQ